MKPPVKYGIIAAAIGILISLLVFVIGLDKSETGQYIGWINFPIMIYLMVLAIRAMRDQHYQGYISYGQAFRTTFILVLVSTLITGLYMYGYFTIINPSMIDYIHDQQLVKMEEQGMSSEMIEQSMEMSKKWTTPGVMSLFTVLGGLLVGTIVGAIVAAFMKKPNPEIIS